MESVFLADFAYPCVAYVIRRLGLEQEIKQLFVATGEEYSSTTNLTPGDIIIWEHSSGITEGIGVWWRTLTNLASLMNKG